MDIPDEKLSYPSGDELEDLGGTGEPVGCLRRYRLGPASLPSRWRCRCWWIQVAGWDMKKKDPIP